MKKPLPYEVLAAVLAIAGAFILVSVLLPVINPGLTRIETHHELPPVGYVIVATPFPLAVLCASWHFNRKARQLKEKESGAARKPEKLKWILFGIVVFIVLYAFLW